MEKKIGYSKFRFFRFAVSTAFSKYFSFPPDYPELTCLSQTPSLYQSADQLGLGVEFHRHLQNGICCDWNTAKSCGGFLGVVNSGLISAVTQDLMGNAVRQEYSNESIAIKITNSMLKPVKIGTKLRGHAWVEEKKNRLVYAKAWLFNEDRKPVFSSSGMFFLPTSGEFERMIGKTLEDPKKEHFVPS